MSLLNAVGRNVFVDCSAIGDEAARDAGLAAA
jgi:hypothetical protein